MFVVLLALVLMFLICSEKFNFGSSVSPSILGFLTVGIGLLSMCSLTSLLYSAGSGVKSVAVDLSGFRRRWFFLVQSCMSLRYGCMRLSIVAMFLCDDSVFMSSAYVSSCTCGGGVGMSDVYMLKSVGDRTLPCGTPVLSFLCEEVALLYLV